MSQARSRRFRNGLAAFAAGLVRRPPLSAGELRALRPERILIVRQQNQMGDMVCATPTFRALREAWPEARIALVTAPVNAEVVRHNPHLDEILLYDKKRARTPGGLVGFARELRNYRPDLAFVLASVSFSVTSAFIGLGSGARWVVGADSRPFGFDVARRAFSLCLPANPELDRHAVDHSLAPLEAVGITTEDRSTVVVPSRAEVEAAERILDDLGWTPGFWALHPGAGKHQNVWPADRFAGIARRAAAAGHRMLVLHGPADAAELEALQGLATNVASERFRVAPACPVGVGAALLQRAERFLCNDTGVMHVAGAVGVPTVALFGPTDPTLWKPPGDGVVAVTGGDRLPDERGDEFGWMESISEDEVWRALQELPGRIPTTE